MLKFKKIKYFLLVLMFCVVAMASKAQQKKIPIQVSPEFGIPFTKLNKDVYPGKTTNISKQFGLDIQYTLNKKWAFSLEGQYRNFSLKKNIEASYDKYIKFDPLAVRNFNASTIFNSLLNIKKIFSSKNGKYKLDLSLGGGLQKLKQGDNVLAFHNPYLLGALDTVYKNGGKSNFFIGQLGVQNTFHITPRISISLGVTAQFAPAIYNVSYNQLPPTTFDQLTFDQFCKSATIAQEVHNAVSFTPVAALRFQFGWTFTGPQEDSTEKYSCFGLYWLNSTKKDSCFKGDSLKFKITQLLASHTALRYEIFIAPDNDLNDQKYLFSLPYPSTNFYILAVLLDANKDYTVIVKLIETDKEKSCLQHISPIKRCPDCCKDSKMPDK